VTKLQTSAIIQELKAEARVVSRPQERHEREADRAAEVVARGGSVANWSFSAVPVSAPEPVQRQEAGGPKSDDDKKKEALSKAGEALLQTPQGKAIKEKVLADPLAKKVTSPAGLVATGVVAAGGIAALAATGKPLPFQPPSIPLDKITPGLSAQVKYEGPVNAPTFVGLTLTYKEQGPKEKKPGRDPIVADIARLKAQQEMFKPESQNAAEKAEEDELIRAWIASQTGLPRLTIPLTPGTAKQDDALKKQDDALKKKEEEEAPVQRAALGPAALPPRAYVDEALSTPGRPLEPRTRRMMEARFGVDFSSVRIHDDASAAATAAGIDAAAFTLGEDVVFGAGRYDPSNPAGRRLLAHELAHVVQQSTERRVHHKVPTDECLGVPEPSVRQGVHSATRR